MVTRLARTPTDIPGRKTHRGWAVRPASIIAVAKAHLDSRLPLLTGAQARIAGSAGGWCVPWPTGSTTTGHKDLRTHSSLTDPSTV